MDENRFIELFDRYYQRQASQPEKDEWLTMLHSGQYDALLQGLIDQYYGHFAPTQSPLTSNRERKLLEEILSNYPSKAETPIKALPRFIRYKWLFRAAAVLTIGIGLFFMVRQDKAGALLSSDKPEIQPGYNQATLTLGNGTKINLDSAKAGILINDEDIHYDDGTKIQVPIHHSPLITYNSLSTPKGGQYQIILSDGTKVWLNAASILKYPSRFSGNKREVEITGEAFFDVAQIKGKAFIVKSKGQAVYVLGTSFNISSYEGEESVRTTLVSGAIQVANGEISLPTYSYKVLKPGQQAINTNGEINVKKVDVETATAWLHGKFIFENETLGGIMRQIARWYNVEVSFMDPSLVAETFEGIITRYSNISEVLNMLETAGDVKFSISGHKVIVGRK
ncbi:FecR family protein [bacterium A37T11]|nr:FecR family protein [bacterium A37T11]